MSDHTDTHTHEHGHDDHGVGHIVEPKILIANGLALLALTWVTVWIAQFHFGELTVWIALFIAGIKATLVCLFFMHLYWDRPFNSLVLVGSVGFVVLFIGLAVTDTFEYRKDIDAYRNDFLAPYASEVTPAAEVKAVKDELKKLAEAEEAAKATTDGS